MNYIYKLKFGGRTLLVVIGSTSFSDCVVSDALLALAVATDGRREKEIDDAYVAARDGVRSGGKNNNEVLA